MASISISAQVVWNGPSLIFDKSTATPEDVITENVILTKGSTGGMFNSVLESTNSPNSPEDTEWAEGTTDNIENLTFDRFTSSVGTGSNGYKPPIGVPLVLHLITDDIYIDVTFSAWAGDIMSYERSTDPSVKVLLNLSENGVLNMAANTSVILGGLKLKTTEAYVLSGPNSIALISTDIAVNANTSIPKYYEATNEISNFTGKIVFSYSDEDIVNFDESLLILEKIDSNGEWTALEPSAVQASNNRVSHDAIDVSFLKITLSSSNSSLSVENLLANNASIVVYPNPTLNTIYIQGTTTAFSAQLFNVNGQKVLETTTNKMDVSSIKQGVYILMIEDSNKTRSSYKLIKK